MQTLKTFNQKIYDIVVCDEDLMGLTADHLNQFQKDYLTASAMREMGRHASDAISSSNYIEDVAGKLIIAAESKSEEKRTVIAKEILTLLLKGAFEECKEIINSQIGYTATALQFSNKYE